ncbi:MAG: DUF937 domain-containing protein [Planctomycetaceae bacterium]
MNIVDLVKSQLGGEVLGKLGGLVGGSEAQTRSAADAAIPAMLEMFGKVAGTKGGGDLLSSMMGKIDLSTIGNLAGALGGSGGSTMGSLGGTLLTTLLGNNLGTIVSAIAKVAGSQPDLVKKLLSYVGPIVLGVIAKQLGGRPDAAGVSRLFAEQKSNIQASVPQGLSLAGFDPTAAISAASKLLPSQGSRGGSGSEGGFPAWVIPALLVLLGVGYGAYTQVGKGPEGGVEMPKPTRVVDDVAVLEGQLAKFDESAKGLFSGLTKLLEGVTDEATAKTALPEIEKLAPSLDEFTKEAGAIPEAGRALAMQLVTDNLGPIQAVVEKVMAIPGVQDILEPVVGPMLEKLDGLLVPAAADAPAPAAAKADSD